MASDPTGSTTKLRIVAASTVAYCTYPLSSLPGFCLLLQAILLPLPFLHRCQSDNPDAAVPPFRSQNPIRGANSLMFVGPTEIQITPWPVPAVMQDQAMSMGICSCQQVPLRQELIAM